MHVFVFFSKLQKGSEKISKCESADDGWIRRDPRLFMIFSSHRRRRIEEDIAIDSRNSVCTINVLGSHESHLPLPTPSRCNSIKTKTTRTYTTNENLIAKTRRVRCLFGRLIIFFVFNIPDKKIVFLFNTVSIKISKTVSRDRTREKSLLVFFFSRN